MKLVFFCLQFEDKEIEGDTDLSKVVRKEKKDSPQVWFPKTSVCLGKSMLAMPEEPGLGRADLEEFALEQETFLSGDFT